MPSPKPTPAAKPQPKPINPPKEPGSGFKAALLLLKLLAICVGFAGTLLSLMAAIGALTDNGYARVIGALVVTIAVPLAIADKLLPEHDPLAGKGIVTDVLSLFLLSFTLIFSGAAAVTGPLYEREGDRLANEGFSLAAHVAYLLGGISADFPKPEAPVAGTEAAADAGADAATEAGADAAAEADAAAVADASAPPVEKAADAGPSSKAEKTPAELFKQLSPSVVTIFVKTGDNEGGGTGFLIDNSAVIVTNHHVINGAKFARVKFENGAVYEDIDVLVDNEAADLALLAIDPNKALESGVYPADAKPLVLGDSDAVVVGERAIAIGNPLGLDHTLTDGLISARRLYEGRQWIQMSVPISPGNSGGPLFNMRGEVIGVNTAQFGNFITRAQNLNLAVPVNELKKLIKASYPGRHKLGDANSASSHW